MNAKIGKNIRWARVSRGMSQKELGAKINREHNTISSYENGKAEVPDDIIALISKALGMTPEELISGTSLSPPAREEEQVEPDLLSLLYQAFQTRRYNLSKNK